MGSRIDQKARLLAIQQAGDDQGVIGKGELERLITSKFEELSDRESPALF